MDFRFSEMHVVQASCQAKISVVRTASLYTYTSSLWGEVSRAGVGGALKRRVRTWTWVCVL